MKRSLTSFVSKETQIKTPTRYHFTFTRMAKINKTDPSADTMWGNWDTSHAVAGDEWDCAAMLEDGLTVPQVIQHQVAL